MAQTKTRVIGMLHIPINTLIAAPTNWRIGLGFPTPTEEDWRLLDDLEHSSEKDSRDAIAKTSFFNFLCEKACREAELYIAHGIKEIALENIAAPYFMRGHQPRAIYWTMLTLAELLRAKYDGLRIGIQILAHSDDWAMDIACRCDLGFVRCESALFDGCRPEGRTPNYGNLAKLYIQRQRLACRSGTKKPTPLVYVDVQKKHTVFETEYRDLDLWLENIIFQKLEGIIITGKGTGEPIDADDLKRAREAIEEAKSKTANWLPTPQNTELLVGSGVNAGNFEICQEYADAVIVGSSMKEGGYWECALDEEHVKSFMNIWNS